MSKHINQKAEQAILGICILNNFHLSKIADIMEEKYFYFAEHQAIWGRFIEIANEMTADQVTLGAFFENNESLSSVGGKNYLQVLLGEANGMADIRDYARTVVELWQKRELEALLSQSIKDLDEKSFDFVGSNLENEISGLAIQEAKKKTQHVSEIIDEMQAEEDAGVSVKFVPTGLPKLDEILNGGIHAQQMLVIGARPSVGKAQPLDSNILTLDGWKKMGDMRIGDNLASVDGKPSKVVGIYPQGKKKIVKLTFRDGREVECCPEHLWKVYYRDWKAPKVINTSRLIEMLGCVRYRKRLWIDEFEGEFGSNDTLPIDPWALGALIGDGCITRAVSFTNSNSEIVNKLRDRLGEDFTIKLRGPSSKIDYSITEKVPQISGPVKINRIKVELEKLGIFGCHSYEKFIPKKYLDSNKSNRLELLRGLMDTDGYVSKNGSMVYYTSSERLAKDVIYLSNSLGATTHLSTKIPSFTYKGEKKTGRLHYVIQISYSKGSEFFTLSKKKCRTLTVKNKQKRNTFESFEVIGEKEAQCIKVSHESELYITDNFIVTHNTSIAQQIILNASTAGKKCLFISLEVDKRNVVCKFLSNLSSINSWRVSNVFCQTAIEKDALKKAKDKLKKFEIYTNDSSYLTTSQISRIVKNQIERQPVDLVVVDYVQIVKGDNSKGKNEAITIKETTTALKALAKQYDVAVISLAQINRKAVEGASQVPTINDFKGSGGIEEDADVAMILHRDRTDGAEDSYFSSSGKLIIAKNRHGRTGEVNINFDGAFGRFNQMDM